MGAIDVNSIEAHGTRVAATEGNGQVYVSLAYRAGKRWRTVLATGCVAPQNIFATECQPL